MATQPLVEIKISQESIELAKRLKEVPVGPICKAMDLQNQGSVQKIYKERISFPNTVPPQPHGLRVWSNRLRGTLMASKTRLDGNTFVSYIGTNAKYAGILEEGGTVQVKAHTRRRYRVSKGKVTFYKNKWTGQSGQLYKTRRTAIKGSEYTVRAHSKTYPARRYIQGPITERLPFYATAIEQAIKDAWDKQQAS